MSKTYAEYFTELRLLYEGVLHTRHRLEQFIRDGEILLKSDKPIYLLVDFSEVYRILHPTLDFLLLEPSKDRLRYTIEQLGINLAFEGVGGQETTDFQPIMVEPYWAEFQGHFATIEKNLGDYLSALGPTGEDRKFQEILEKSPRLKSVYGLYERFLKSQDNQHQLEAEFKKSLLDLLDSQERHRHIKAGLNAFDKYVGAGTIKFTLNKNLPKAIQSVNGEEAKASPFYDFAFETLCAICETKKSGDRRERANRIDAWAIAQAYEIRRRQIETVGEDSDVRLAIFSNSDKMRSLLYGCEGYLAQSQYKDSIDLRFVPEIRDSFYMMLYLYGKEVGFEEAMSEVSDLVAEVSAFEQQLTALSVDEFRRSFSDRLGAPVEAEAALAQLRKAKNDLQFFQFERLLGRLNGETHLSEMDELEALAKFVEHYTPATDGREDILKAIRGQGLEAMKAVLDSTMLIVQDASLFRTAVSSTLTFLSQQLKQRRVDLKASYVDCVKMLDV